MFLIIIPFDFKFKYISTPKLSEPSDVIAVFGENYPQLISNNYSFQIPSIYVSSVYQFQFTYPVLWCVPHWIETNNLLWKIPQQLLVHVFRLHFVEKINIPGLFDNQVADICNEYMQKKKLWTVQIVYSNRNNYLLILGQKSYAYFRASEIVHCTLTLL